MQDVFKFYYFDEKGIFFGGGGFQQQNQNFFEPKKFDIFPKIAETGSTVLYILYASDLLKSFSSPHPQHLSRMTIQPLK